MSRPKAAIYLLTRGYPDVRYYGRLIQRNEHIYENFNKHLDEQYPLIFFHEGNIPKDHQDFILSHNKNKFVSFVDTSSTFVWPSHVPYNDVKELQHFSLGYRLMCKFNCFHIWEYCKEYDYVFRIDEDSNIGMLNYDVFEYMQDKKYDYMVGRFCDETHELTNSTIPKKAHELLGDRWKENDYDHTNLWVPYSNLLIAKVSLFRQSEVQTFLTELTNDPMFYTNRWGDHVIQGIVLKAFSSPEKVGIIPNFEYIHGSHVCHVKNGRAMEGILSENEARFFDLIPSGKQPQHYSVSNTIYN